MRSKKLVVAVACLGLALSFVLAPRARGQLTNVDGPQATPVHGVGHDYIHGLSETVNPATGSVSLRIDLWEPPSRGFTVPFSILYNSSGVFLPVTPGNGASLQTSQLYADAPVPVGLEWTYSLPMLTAIHGEYTWVDGTNPSAQTIHHCFYATDFVFQDPSGARHLLPISIFAGQVGPADCGSGVPINNQFQLSGGDDFYFATTTRPTNNFAYPNPVTITGVDGTTFYFSSFFSVQTGGTPMPGWGAFPTYIEDRNGNIARLAYSAADVTLTDTTGRVAAHASAINSSSSQNAITISGLANPFVAQWGTQGSSFTVPYTVLPGSEISGQPGCFSFTMTGSGKDNVIESLRLPNGQSYLFQYDSTYGLLNKITYPSGGYVSYSWGMIPLKEFLRVPYIPDPLVGETGECLIHYGTPAITNRYVSFDGSTLAEEQDFSYSTTWSSSDQSVWTSKQTTVTTKDLIRGQSSQVIYTYAAAPLNTPPDMGWPNFAPAPEGQTPVEQSIVYMNFNGSVAKTVNKSWLDKFLLDCETETLDNGLTSGIWYAYHATSLSDKKEFEYGLSGSACTGSSPPAPPAGITPKRETVINYASFAVSPTGGMILNRPCQTIVYGNGNRAAETDVIYDNGAGVCGSAGTPSISAVSGLPAGTHDETNYGANSTASRGNATTITRKCFVSTTSQNCSDATSSFSFDETGQVASWTDPLRNTTQYSFVDNFSDTAPTGVNTNAYLTQITRPVTNGVKHISTFSYAYSDGQLTGSTDENSNSTSYHYDDPLRRLTETDYPDNGQTKITYNDSGPNPTVSTTKKITSTLSLAATTVLDGLGHVAQTQVNSDPGGVDYLVTAYDGLGRVASVTNPYRSFSESTFGLTSYGYDALGRATDVVKADGSVAHTDYSGNVTTVTDEAGHTRRSTADALGRMTEVDEQGASSALGTPGAVARVSGSISGHVQMDPAVLSAVLQTINTLLLADSPATTTTAPAATATSTSTPNSTAAPNTGSPPPPEAITNAPAATTASSPANPNYDTGKVWLSIKGFRATAYYQQGSTAGSIARDLASQFNVAGSPVFARVDGDSQLTLLSRIPGTAGNLTVDDQGTQSDNPSKYPNPSFTISMSPSNWSNAAPGDLSSPLVTLYQYDALGNLLRADQKGTAPSDSTQWRTRTFAYDSLSRLLTASNPESGTINYSYDANGNLLQKTSPAPNQTGSTTQTISYCYDALNRVTGKAYSPQNCPLTSPAVTWTYDAGTNGIGHMTSLTDQAGSASYSYDVIGRIKAESRTIAGATKSMSYLYNLDGSIQSITYPSNATITYTPDAAGRMLSAIDNSNGINYVTGATYSAGGLLTSFVSGNSGITNSFSYNQRLQPVTMSAALPTQTLFSLTYDFHFGAGDNGNVFAISNNKDTARSQSFTYDALNRLTSAQNAGTDCSQLTLQPPQTKYWGNNYGYDAWGNLLSKSPTKCTPESMSVTALANNQLSGYGYDAAGNVTSGHMNSDPSDVITATYDPENRIATATSSKKGTTTNYTYDADGNRIRKASGTTGTLYWYMSLGIVGESDLLGNLQSEYVFFDSERVARKDFPSGAVSYYFSDHLKTTDIVTDAQGTIKNESDFYPFGGELQFANGDSNHYKFTGKERDSETGLDYFGARYYSNGLGRFTSVDPKMITKKRMVHPQQWNMYGYSRNNPTSYFDPDGKEVQALDAGALNLIRQTLPANVRSSVVTDKNGVISGKALSGVKSNDANFQTLKHMVDAKGTVQVSTGPAAANKDGKTVEFKYESSETVKADMRSKGLTPTEGKDYSTNFSGITYGANESKSGNIEVHVSDSTGKAADLGSEEQAVTMGHELYVHGDRLLDGRPAGHENTREGEVNKETHEVEQRTRKNAKEKDPQ